LPPMRELPLKSLPPSKPPARTPAAADRFRPGVFYSHLQF
jgi:hypothetical protein